MAVQLHIAFVDQNRCSGCSVKLGQSTNMIDMSMGADNGANLQAMLPKNFLDTLDFIARVHDDCFTRHEIAQNRAIALQHPDRNDFVNQFLRHRTKYTSTAKFAGTRRRGVPRLVPSLVRRVTPPLHLIR